MSGRRPWSQIRQPRPPEEEAEIAAGVRDVLRENALNRLRRREHVSQQELARLLGVSQANISRIEHESDPQISTMRRFIEALGGELIVQARIGDETIDLLPTE